MKRLRVLLAMIAALTMATVGLQSTPAHAAYPTAYFTLWATGGHTSGTLTWYNRSVGVAGGVYDSANVAGYSQVRFTFWLTNSYTTPYATTTRTANYGETTPYGFTQTAPSGGISLVEIQFCTSWGDCAEPEDHWRWEAS